MTFHAIEDLDSETWYIDTRCKNHMSGNKPLFVNLNENFKSVVKVENVSKCEDYKNM